MMAIVNVTPDSFSDGGERLDPAQAIDDGLRFVSEGADIVDVGGESTRPGSQPTPPTRSCAASCRWSRGWRGQGVRRLGRHAPRGGGARLPRCRRAHRQRRVGAARRSATLLPLVAERGVPVVLMHRRGRPEDKYEGPAYRDVVEDVRALPARARRGLRGGGHRARAASRSIPASASARASQENLALIAGAGRLAAAGYPVLVGSSRKSFIGRLTGIKEARRRDPASVWLAVEAARRGAAIVRVHDVAGTRQALAVSAAMR